MKKKHNKYIAFHSVFTWWHFKENEIKKKKITVR